MMIPSRIATGILGSLCLTSFTFAQESDPFADPASSSQNNPPITITADTLNYTLTFEVFSLPIAQVAELKRQGLNDQAFYQAILRAVDQDQGTLVKFLESMALEGQNATVEQVSEHIYPTEYEPPEMSPLPANLPENFKNFDQLIIPATPTSFDTKNLGDTLETEIQKHPDLEGVVIGTVKYNHVDLQGERTWGQGPSTTTVPIFKVRALKTQAKFHLDTPRFLGTMEDPSENEGKKNLWVAFARVTADSPIKKQPTE